MEFRARKRNYEQMCPLKVRLIDGRRMEMIPATSISGNKGLVPKPPPPSPPTPHHHHCPDILVTALACASWGLSLLIPLEVKNSSLWHDGKCVAGAGFWGTASWERVQHVLMLLSEEKERSIRNQNNLGTASRNQQRTLDSIEVHEHGMVLLMLKWKFQKKRIQRVLYGFS